MITERDETEFRYQIKEYLPVVSSTIHCFAVAVVARLAGGEEYALRDGRDHLVAFRRMV